MFKYIQTRLVFLIIVTILIFTAILIAMKSFENKRLGLIFEDIKYAKQVDFDKIINFKGEPLKFFAYDYTIWDEMVNFIRTKDKKWAKFNLDTSLNTFRADILWVYNPNLSLIYSTKTENLKSISNLPLPSDKFKLLFANNKFPHFFEETSEGIIEIHGATVHPTSDIERKTTVRGYFFVGRLWTKEYISEISKATNSSLAIVPQNDANNKQESNNYSKIIFYKVLNKWDGTPLKYIEVSQTLQIFSEIQRLSFFQFIFFVVFSISILLILAIFLIRWVSKPLKIISECLAKNSPEYVQELSKKQDEFGYIARLVLRFFEQKQALLSEIIEHKNTAVALRESEEKYHSLVDNAYDMIQSLSPDGKFIFVNPSWIKTMGYEWEELQKMNIMDVIHPDSKSHCKNMFEQIHKGNPVKEFETCLITKNGEKIFVEGTVSLRYSEDKIIASQCIFRNITERKKNEEERKKLEFQLLQSQKMEAIGLLAGGVAHDFNNILSAIVSYTTLVQIKLQKHNPLNKYLEKILSLTENATNLTKSLLTFSRKQTTKLVPIDINITIEAFGKLISRIIGEDIKLKVIKYQEPLIVMSDKSQIEQVLMNLATNARDAMPSGGEIVIKVEPVEIDNILRPLGEFNPPKYLKISFSDTGTGMNEITKKGFLNLSTQQKKSAKALDLDFR